MAETFRYKRIKLESVSESSSNISDTESVYSLQGRETEYARDTSDTTDNFEFEVPRISDFQNVLLSSSDESELKDIAELGAVVATLAYEDSKHDIAIQADSSEEISTSPTSNSDVDPELPRSDYLDFEQCLICKTENKDISYPYCSRCFMWKKSFFPPRPKRKKKKKDKKLKQCIKETVIVKPISERASDVERLKIKEIEETEETEDIKEIIKFQEIKDIKHLKEIVRFQGIKKIQENKEIQEYKEIQENKEIQEIKNIQENKEIQEIKENSAVSHCFSSSSKLSSQESSFDEGPSNASQENPICTTCFARKMNGVFVHGPTGHMYSCFSCAKKTWRSIGVCPLCRKKCKDVIKLYIT